MVAAREQRLLRRALGTASRARRPTLSIPRPPPAAATTLRSVRSIRSSLLNLLSLAWQLRRYSGVSGRRLPLGSDRSRLALAPSTTRSRLRRRSAVLGARPRGRRRRRRRRCLLRRRRGRWRAGSGTWRGVRGGFCKQAPKNTQTFHHSYASDTQLARFTSTVAFSLPAAQSFHSDSAGDSAISGIRRDVFSW